MITFAKVTARDVCDKCGDECAPGEKEGAWIDCKVPVSVGLAAQFCRVLCIDCILVLRMVAAG